LIELNINWLRQLASNEALLAYALYWRLIVVRHAKTNIETRKVMQYNLLKVKVYGRKINKIRDKGIISTNSLDNDNVDIGPAIVLKNENGAWIENEYDVACTQMGPMGYFGILDIAGTKHDTISLFNEMGKFKLRYRFLVDNDTLDFDSNEFLIYGLEL